MPATTALAARAATVTRANVAAGTVDTSIAAADGSRLDLAVYNDGTATLYLACGTAAATRQSFTVALAGSAYYEAPASLAGEAWRGIWDAAAGTARVTTATGVR